MGVFASYVSQHGHAFIDRALYLPKAWAEDSKRMAAVHVPEATRFATKPAIARAMIERAIAANAPFSWVAADSVYGVGDIEIALRRAGKGLCSGRERQSSLPLVGQAARRRRNHQGHHREPFPSRLAAPVSR
ncbi:transposase [Nitrobacter sp. JJSN]|uniref:transposase n=1 Tax=Nitrobacter sp. JJSN TaxID=3453033 RepID=UPI003F761963